MLKVVDLFCGAGGLSYAVQQLGYDLVGALEIDKNSCITFENNIKNTKLINADILELTPTEFLAKIGAKSGDIDLVVGGPPCQGFSSLRTTTKTENDPRNELIIEYFNYIHCIKPKAFLVENVPGMLWERNKKYLKKFYQLAEENGYTLYDPCILDAKYFGVPQTRKRVFILGLIDGTSTENFKWPLEPTHDNPESIEVKTGMRSSWVNADIVFKKQLRKTDPNNVHFNHTQELIEVFKSTPLNGGSRTESNRVLPCHKNHNGHKDVYGRIDPSRPGPTMTTACTNPSKGRFVHPTEHHGITVRHAARFQTFPDNYVFHGGIQSASRQIGNAVPIELAKAIIKHVSEELLLVSKHRKAATTKKAA